MKSLQEFKHVLTEEEKQDYQKFDMLVRAGLANKSQINRLHKILSKMGEDRPVFNQQDRQIMQDLFNKMVDLVTNNKQIFQQTRRAVREELEEAILDTSDYKVGPSGRKVKAHRIKIGDKAYGKEDDIKEEEIVEAETLKGDPPFTLVLKRKAIRMYPNDTKIALYYNDRLKKYFSIPYSDKENVDAPLQAEETQIDEAVDVVGKLQKIKDTHQHGTINHKDGSASKIDVQTAHAILTVHKALNDENKKKFSDMMSRSNHHMKKAADFAWKQVK